MKQYLNHKKAFFANMIIMICMVALLSTFGNEASIYGATAPITPTIKITKSTFKIINYMLYYMSIRMIALILRLYL